MRTIIPLLLAHVLVACSSLPEKAIITKEDVDSVYREDAPISSNSAILPRAGESWFKVRRGSSKILLVAGHATHPKRDGELRFADGGTGGFALALAALTDSTVIYTMRAAPSDPNYYDDNEFKAELSRFVAEQKPDLVLDIHGSHWARPYDVDFGTMGLKSLNGQRGYLTGLIAAFRTEGLDNLSVDYFAASKNQTVTKFVSKMGVPCIQLEINSNYMPLKGDIDGARSQRIAQALQALVRFIRKNG